MAFPKIFKDKKSPSLLAPQSTPSFAPSTTTSSTTSVDVATSTINAPQPPTPVPVIEKKLTLPDAIVAISSDDVDVDTVTKFLKSNSDQHGILSIYAIKNHKLDILELLFTLGVDPNKNTQGGSLLHVAAEAGSSKIIALLLDAYKADIDARDVYFRTPLYVAVAAGQIDAVKILLERGADVNAVTRDPSGFGCLQMLRCPTALHKACANPVTKINQKEIVGLLIDHNANLEDEALYINSILKDNLVYVTPLEVAIALENIEIVELIRKRSQVKNTLNNNENNNNNNNFPNSPSLFGGINKKSM